jgi:tetratricopeptide (TPR) repeat protein
MMKRSRTQSPGLKHLAYFEALADLPESSPEACSATAGLLTLRLIDHWILAGSSLVEPESVSVRSVRQAIMAMPDSDPGRETLIGLVNMMQTLREVEVTPLLPRLFAYGRLLERRAAFALAADVYRTTMCLADEEYDGDLLVDAQLRLGQCERTLGLWDSAHETFTEAWRLAKRRSQPSRAMRARVGLAVATFSRGNVPKAEQMLLEIVDESRAAGFTAELAQALHACANVASLRSQHDRAVLLAYESMQITADPAEVERILSDLGAFLVRMGRFEAARDALLVLEGRATREEVRVTARANLVAVAARRGDRALFYASIARVTENQMTPVARVNYLIESARGFRLFGEPEKAARLLDDARAYAVQHELNRAIIELDEMIAERDPREVRAGTDEQVPSYQPLSHVEGGLRRLAAALET